MIICFYRTIFTVLDTFENQGRLETSVGNDSVSSLDGARRDGGPNDVQRPLRLDIIPPPSVSSVNHRRSSPMVWIATGNRHSCYTVINLSVFFPSDYRTAVKCSGPRWLKRPKATGCRCPRWAFNTKCNCYASNSTSRRIRHRQQWLKCTCSGTSWRPRPPPGWRLR